MDVDTKLDAIETKLDAIETKPVGVPVFNGVYPCGWISRVERFFRLGQYTDEEKLRLVSLNIKEDAFTWFKVMSFRNWNDFKSRLYVRFGNVKPRSPSLSVSASEMCLDKDLVQEADSPKEENDKFELDLVPQEGLFCSVDLSYTLDNFSFKVLVRDQVQPKSGLFFEESPSDFDNSLMFAHQETQKHVLEVSAVAECYEKSRGFRIFHVAVQVFDLMLHRKYNLQKHRKHVKDLKSWKFKYKSTYGIRDWIQEQLMIDSRGVLAMLHYWRKHKTKLLQEVAELIFLHLVCPQAIQEFGLLRRATETDFIRIQQRMQHTFNQFREDLAEELQIVAKRVCQHFHVIFKNMFVQSNKSSLAPSRFLIETLNDAPIQTGTETNAVQQNTLLCNAASIYAALLEKIKSQSHSRFSFQGFSSSAGVTIWRVHQGEVQGKVLFVKITVREIGVNHRRYIMQYFQSFVWWELRKALFSLWHRWRRKDSHNDVFGKVTRCCRFRRVYEHKLKVVASRASYPVKLLAEATPFQNQQLLIRFFTSQILEVYSVCPFPKWRTKHIYTSSLPFSQFIFQAEGFVFESKEMKKNQFPSLQFLKQLNISLFRWWVTKLSAFCDVYTSVGQVYYRLPLLTTTSGRDTEATKHLSHKLLPLSLSQPNGKMVMLCLLFQHVFMGMFYCETLIGVLAEILKYLSQGQAGRCHKFMNTTKETLVPFSAHLLQREIHLGDFILNIVALLWWRPVDVQLTCCSVPMDVVFRNRGNQVLCQLRQTMDERQILSQMCNYNEINREVQFLFLATWCDYQHKFFSVWHRWKSKMAQLGLTYGACKLELLGVVSSLMNLEQCNNNCLHISLGTSFISKGGVLIRCRD